MPSVEKTGEDALPALPVPPLDATLTKLRASLKPLLNSHELADLDSKINDFYQSPIAEKLQAHLKKFYENEECYLDHLNLDHILIDPKALPRNPFLILENDPRKDSVLPQDQANRAAALTLSSMKFVGSLRNGSLSRDTTPGGEPITMKPYWNLFGTTRTPEYDSIKTKTTTDSDYILIVSKSQFYTLKVLDEKNDIIHTAEELAALFQQVAQESDAVENPNMTAIGSITSDNYRYWKHARQMLQRDCKENIDKIDAALFVLVLDHSEPEETDESLASIISVGSLNIDSRGIQTGSCISRWYDKMQLVVTKNAIAGVIWDSFSQDGTTVLRFTSDIFADSVLRLADGGFSLFPTIKTPRKGDDKPQPVKLQWNIGSDLQTFIHLSETRLTDLICSHSTNTQILKYGRKFARKIGVKADSLIQVSIQIAHYALYGKPVSTVEPVSTRLFRNSRSELLPLQDDSITRTCQIFVSDASEQVRWKAFKESCDIHADSLRKAAHGEGFEKHLKALQNVYLQREIFNQLYPELHIPDEVPPLIFDDAIYPLFVPEMVASNCGNPAMRLFGLTPAVANGFGIGYIIKDDVTEFCLISQYRQGGRFLQTVNWVLHQLAHIWKHEVGVKKIPHAYEFDNMMQRERRKSSVSHSIQVQRMSRSTTIGSSEDEVDLALGGYGYFDIDDLTLRSTNQSHSGTPMLSHANSSTDLTSSDSVKAVPELDKNFGRKLKSFHEKLREGFEKHSGTQSSGSSTTGGDYGGADGLSRFDAKFDRSEVGKKVDVFMDDDDDL
ncbi:Carnitine O-acetyltransferase YAT2 [Cyberlindnera fabianii]|uniref:Carnitine O-acetyltransferase YAT2 n=1 Tax=Cyberlindnera fabianii TaxID=36022 RepID=A0A1V2L021_CYBFA|nr:Carnitine O-acetyltransferase YAT2 [Cyberlindnera fabianii]